MFDRKVQVRFVDADGGAVMGETESPPEALPESFEAYTQLDIAGQQWEVVKAEPMTRAEYVKTCQLTLTLRKLNIQKIPLDKLIYSLPTICDGIPGVAEGTTKLGKRVLELHEDDWRQIELVSRVHKDAVEWELAGVRRARESSVGPGFKDVHIRKRPTSPVADSGLTVAELERALAGAQPFEGLAYRQVAGLIGNGFAFEAGEMLVYGLAPAGAITDCGFLRLPEQPPEALLELCRRRGLWLVDWCAARVFAQNV